jgi:hypothetical protein
MIPSIDVFALVVPADTAEVPSFDSSIPLYMVKEIAFCSARKIPSGEVGIKREGSDFSEKKTKIATRCS